jgi:hypothetical protein
MLRKSFTKKISQKHYEFIHDQFSILSELTSDIKEFKKKYPDLSKEERALFYKVQAENIEKCIKFEKGLNKEIQRASKKVKPNQEKID